MTDQQNVDPEDHVEDAAPTEPDLPDATIDDDPDAEGAAEFPPPETLESADVEPIAPVEPAPEDEPDDEQESQQAEPHGVAVADDEEEDSSIYPLPSEEESWGGLLKIGAIIAGIVTLLYMIFRKRD